MNIDKKTLLNLIKEVKSSLDEAPTVPAPAVTQPQNTQVQNKQQAPAPTAPAAQPASKLPPTALPVLQGLSDMLFISKHPQYPVLKPWLQSLGVRVK